MLTPTARAALRYVAGLEPVEIALCEQTLAEVLAAVEDDERATVPPPAGE